MKLTVLSDNRTNDRMLQTEHGLSILLQTERHKILLDTGASDVFIRNAERLGIDLSDIDYVFTSHGHSDHPLPVHTVVGGFHLLDGYESEEELRALAQRLKTNYPATQFYTSHCTGDGVFAVIKDVMGEQLQAFCLGTVIAVP